MLPEFSKEEIEEYHRLANTRRGSATDSRYYELRERAYGKWGRITLTPEEMRISIAQGPSLTREGFETCLGLIRGACFSAKYNGSSCFLYDWEFPKMSFRILIKSNSSLNYGKDGDLVHEVAHTLYGPCGGDYSDDKVAAEAVLDEYAISSIEKDSGLPKYIMNRLIESGKAEFE
jgi:hypothetical protein